MMVILLRRLKGAVCVAIRLSKKLECGSNVPQLALNVKLFDNQARQDLSSLRRRIRKMPLLKTVFNFRLTGRTALLYFARPTVTVAQKQFVVIYFAPLSSFNKCAI
jgi:hypothetical protein